jgi:hypothetical protein
VIPEIPGDLAGRLGTWCADASEFAALSKSQQASVQTFQQGDILEDMTELVVLGADGSAAMVEAPLGAVLISQTCDIVQPSRLTAQVARRVRLTGPPAAEARDGKRPRYAALPACGPDDFVDLEVISTTAKARLAHVSRLKGVISDDEVRRFAGSIARKFGRFPFPDEVTAWLRPLEKVVSSRARKSVSPEGQALRQVTELRVESARGWAATPYDLTLAVVVEHGTLPLFPGDDLPDRPETVSTWLRGPGGGSARSPSQVAERLSMTGDPAEQYWLWMALGDAWAACCKPKGTHGQDVRDAVRSVIGEVVPADEYPLTRVRRSELLDLDHLSPPTPR